MDILKALHSQHPEGFIDLIYIDPPFNSKRDYNILFESHDIVGDATAQKRAFADTWSNVSYVDTLNEISGIDRELNELLANFDSIRISKSAVSYLTTMAIRIHYMHKVLKDSGSFYIHCDPNMSHYLKLLCDLIFGRDNFKNEIIWQRTNAHNMKTDYFGRVHDVILFYTKSKKYTWNIQHTEYSEQQKKRFKKDADGRLYKAENLTYSSPNPARNFEWRGSQPPPASKLGSLRRTIGKMVGRT